MGKHNDGTQKRRKKQNTETVATAERRVLVIQNSVRKSDGVSYLIR